VNSSFTLPEPFWAVQRASGPVFMFCSLGPNLGDIEGVGSRFHIFRSRTRFQRYRGRRASFHVLHSLNHFRRYGGRRVPFSCFALPDQFWAAPRALSPIFMFCAPGLVFGGTEVAGSCFHILRSRSRFRRYRGRRVPFSRFAFSSSFSSVPREYGLAFMFCAPGPVFGDTERPGSLFMFCAPGPIFGCTEGVRSRFYVLRSRDRF
jgi:hypothetical protein